MFWKREPARLFLGSVSDATGNAVRHLEGLMGTSPPAVDQALLFALAELIALPKADSVDAPLLATDMAFDVAVQSYRSGSVADLSLGPIGFPLYWRPRVRLAARLYRLQSQKTKTTFHISQPMPWSVYLGRVLSWRVLAGLERPARPGDLDLLLRQAIERLVTKLRSAV